MKRFWNWIRNEAGGRVLRLEGPIDEESFWGDEVTPKTFREELEADSGDITVWINSPGGNVFAAAEIYTMLRDYQGAVTVKIDAIAASAASVIAMAGNKVLMSPVAMLMIHDPSTIAMGNARDMEKAISTLNEVKESIINAYAFKTGLTHSRIAKLMENETWMNAKKAVELGFADEILFEAVEPEEKPDEEDPDEGGEGTDPEEEKEEGIHLTAQMYSSRQMGLTILNRLGIREEKPSSDTPKSTVEGKPTTGPKPPERPVLDLDGKTEDGSVPYNILLKQLECMR
jgi:ATP-dependent Clp protease protease subunit